MDTVLFILLLLHQVTLNALDIQSPRYSISIFSFTVFVILVRAAIEQEQVSHFKLLSQKSQSIGRALFLRVFDVKWVLALLPLCEVPVWISVNQLKHSSDALNLSMSDGNVEKRVTILVLGQK